MAGPLHGLKVLDFSTLLPGPLATLMLAEAGAVVTKVERPGGEDMRHFQPAHGHSSAPFMALNGGKNSIVLDLKTPVDVAKALELASSSDVVVEQFRPGVMDRLGLGFEHLRLLNPGLIYCSITGFGQTGPRSQQAGHDLNYQALSGVLAQSLKPHNPAPLPPALLADIAGGAYPAVINILLGLRQRDLTGKGCHLDISMTDGAASFALFADAARGVNGVENQDWEAGGGRLLLDGGSPRYQIYPTRDGWFLAVGALEEKFWKVFCEAINLPPALRGPEADASEAIEAVATIIRGRDATEWQGILERLDCCCTVARTPEQARIERSASPAPRVVDISGATAQVARIPICPLFRPADDILRIVPDLNPPNDQERE